MKKAPSVVKATGEAPRCRVCRKPIEPEAIKCTECDSYQNWRRYLDFSATILSLLIAVISVSGLVAPIIARTFRHDRSDVHASLRAFRIVPMESRGVVGGDVIYVNSYGVEVDLLLSNPGEKPGFIDAVTVRLNGVSGPIASTELPLDSDATLVAPGDFSVVRLRNRLILASPGLLPEGEIDRNKPPSIKLAQSAIIVRLLQSDLRPTEVKLHGPSGDVRVIVE